MNFRLDAPRKSSLTMCMVRPSAAKALLLSVAACLASSGLRAQTPVEPMIPLFHQWHWKAAPETVKKVVAGAPGTKRVQFVVLMLGELDEAKKVRRWGTVWDPPAKAPSGGKPIFQALTPEMRSTITGWLTDAFRAATTAGLEISVLCQVDAADTGAVQEWRNHFDFDPAVTLDGGSYESAVLGPVVAALDAAVPKGAAVELAVEGEMGQTLFTHPTAWRQIVQRLKSAAGHTNWRVGLSANYENVAAGVKPDASSAADRQALMAAADFIGLSCYAKAGLPPTAADFTACVEAFAAEWAAAGCPIPPGKPLRFTELGLGGGGFDADWKLQVPAPILDRMGKAAFFGTDDPAKNPWTDEARRNYRRAWHRAALDFLSEKRTAWTISTAFLWSFASHDVHGFERPAFRDEAIVEDIRAHNAALREKR